MRVSLKQRGAGAIQTQTLAAAQSRRGAGQAAGIVEVLNKQCGYSTDGGGRDTKLRRGGMKNLYIPGTHQEERFQIPCKKACTAEGEASL